MENITIPSRDKHWSRFHAVLSLLILGFYALCLYVPERWLDLYNSYGKLLLISMCALCFWYTGFRGCLERKLVIAYALWFFVSRLLNTDIYLQNELDMTISRFLCAALLTTCLALDGEDRRRFLDGVFIVYCGIFFVAVLIGLYCSLVGCYITLPPEGMIFGMDNYDFYRFINYLCMFNTNRTISCVWVFLAICLTSYEFFRCRKTLWRVIVGIMWLVFFAGMSITFSRTVNVAFCVSGGMLGLLLGIRHLKTERKALRVLILVLITIGSMLASYVGLTVTQKLLHSVSEIVSVSVDRQSDSIVTYYENADSSFSDPRLEEGLTEASDLNGRGDIYRAAIAAIRQNPKILLRGSYTFKLMDPVNAVIQNYIIPYKHVHNYLLQVLLLTGLPGLLIVVAFTVLLVVRMIRLFFAKDSTVPFCAKLLIMPVAGILIYSMLEICIFTNPADIRAISTDLRELMFFLLSGAVLAYSAEASSKRRTDAGSV